MPPLVIMATVGNSIFVARSRVRAIFSPTAQPIVPPMKPKSRTMSITCVPAIEAVPVSTASVRPVLCWSWKMLLLYDLTEANDRGSREIRERFISLKLFGSTSDSMRSPALRL